MAYTNISVQSPKLNIERIAFNGSTGVIGGGGDADSEYDIVYNMWRIFVVVYD